MAVILLAHLVLSVLYSVVVPLWEAHDEWAHFKFVEYVARHKALPPPGERLTKTYEYDEATQPPLYYLLAALPVLAVDTSDGLAPIVNPYATRGTGEGGVNFAVHDPSVEGFPWRGTVLAAHLIRFVSILVGTLGCLATYALTRFLWPDQLAVSLGALAIHAFAPQFLFINSVITNDVLVSCLGGWALYFAARLVLAEPSARDIVGLGLTTALAVLTKYTALALLPLVAVAVGVVIWRAWRAGRMRGRLVRWLAVGIVTLVLLLGAWFWRNWRTTGHLLPRFRQQIQLLAEQGLLRGLDWANLPRLLRYAFQTFWASFGWGNVGPPRWVFVCLAAICGLACLGVVLGIWRERKRTRVLAVGLLLLDCLLLIALPLYQELRRGGVLLRGRYLLPAMPAVAALLAWGLSRWIAARGRAVVMAVLAGVMLAAAVWVPWGLLAPAYAAPPLLSEAEIPESAERLGAVFGGKAEIVAYDLWPEVVSPGDGLAVTLWWRALAPMKRSFTIGVHLVTADDQPYAAVAHYPGGGNFATTLWRPGDLFKETYWLTVADDMPTPIMGRIAVAMYVDDEKQPHLAVTDPQGNAVGHAARFGRLAVRSKVASAGAPEVEAAYTLREEGGGQLSLLGYDGGAAAGPLGRDVLVRLYWSVDVPLQREYTVFAHLWDTTGRFVWGDDGPPAAGLYPTDLWAAGETVVDERRLRLPSSLPVGRYRLLVGLYDLSSNRRLEALGSAGIRVVDDAIPLLDVGITTTPYQHFVPYLLR